MKRIIVLLCLPAMCMATVWAQTTDSPYLYGIHWYGNTDSISPGDMTDVEDMTGSKGVWDLEITHVDSNVAPAWDQPSYYANHCLKVTQGKGHSLIFRVQPYWGRNVPHPSDPYSVSDYANDCKAAAQTLKDYVHIWQIGNEVNLREENHRWDGSDYTILWEPTPAQYAATYIACRDKIHEVTPNTSPAEQIVLMQPAGPGNIDTWRYMSGVEFLWRQIAAVPDKSKIDGFALHGYAEPGGAEYGLDGFWDSIREQLMIIDAWGLGDRPVFITEFNKHMPNTANAYIAAKFLHRAYTYMNEWNNSSGGEWLGLPNHNIVAATWFVYPDDYGWNDYSLEYWKSQIADTSYELNPWYSFQYACSQDYAKGAFGGGASSIPHTEPWWEDDLDGNTLDTDSPLPDWRAETTGGGSVVMSGNGSVRFLGNGTNNGGGGIRTAGYVYDNFYLDADFTITDASRSSTSGTEANMDIRFRESSKGYSVTFYTTDSPTNTNRVVLRRVNDWTQIGNFSTLAPGGITSGDSFNLQVRADGASIDVTVYKNSQPSPVVEWNINDDGQHVGWIRLLSWNLTEARVNRVTVAGVQYSKINAWCFY